VASSGRSAKMSEKSKYEIIELAQDQRVLTGQKYQKSVYFAAQTGIWIGHLYFALRSLSVLLTPSWTWQVWTLLLVEGIFLREFAMVYRHIYGTFHLTSF
jgi:fatty acid desaturase